MLIEVVLFVTVATLFMFWTTGKCRNRPPNLSLVHCIMHTVTKQPKYKSFKQLVACYGGLFSTRVALQKVFVVNSHEVVKELFDKGNDTAGRIPYFTLAIVSRAYKKTFHDMHVYNWKYMRDVGHKTLVKHGLKQKAFYKILEIETSNLTKLLAEKVGHVIDPSSVLMLTVVNITTQVLFNQRFSLDDAKFQSILQILSRTHIDTGILRTYAPEKPVGGEKKSFLSKHPFEAELEAFIHAEQQNYQQYGVRNVASAIIHEIYQNCRLPNNKDAIIYTIVFELFVSSLEPVFAALCWVLVYTSHWKNIQDKLYTEICKNQSDGKFANYLKAVVHETLRSASVVPLYSRQVTKDVSTFGGYEIPKNSTLLINTYALHHDERVWEAPHVFNPSRWIDKQGKFKMHCASSFLPFGGGRRRCVGESMAKEELFYILSSIVSAFEFEEVETNELQAKEGTFNTPGAFKVLVKKRCNGHHQVQ